MRLIYLAGPYRAATIAGVVANIAAARAAALEVVREGHYPVTPHLNTGLMDGEAADEHFLLGALTMMLRCDEVRLLPGWRASEGTCLEVAAATRHGIPIVELESRT